jgi:hypothetical protein
MGSILTEESPLFDDNPRPSKRQRHVVDTQDSLDLDILPPHHLGIRPEGNAYTDESKVNIRQKAGYFASLSDELILHLLEYLDARELLALGSSSKFLYAFAHYDELWKALFIQQ